MDAFPPGKEMDVDLYKAGLFLGCAFSSAAMFIWAIGILAAGQSSTMTGTYAGQFAMEGFLNLQWARWRRVLFTRLIAIVPTFCVALFSQIDQVTKMNDYLNAVMSLQLPFATIPTIAFTSCNAIMGDFVNGYANRIISVLLSFVVISINLYFIVNQVQGADLSSGWNILIGNVLLCKSLMLFNVNCLFLYSFVFNLLHIVQHLFNRSYGRAHGKLKVI